jgi:carbonic anhydrase
VKPSDRLLLNNKSWLQQRNADDPTFFKRLASQQTPKFLWIGCSDSRVPANTITGTDPGEIFVHRNIANVCVPTDLNMLSVLQYAVEVLQVEHVIVCGHYGCGGVAAALTKRYIGTISHWLRHVRDVHALHSAEIAKLAPEERVNRMCELNVMEQAASLVKTSIIQEAWSKRKGPWIHAWVYSLADGALKELSSIEPGSAIDPAYQLEF